LAAIVAAVALTLVYFGWDFLLRRQHSVPCGSEEGVHYTIDLRDFATRYSGYTVDLEAEAKDRARFSAKIGEVQLQQLSDSLQQSNEFRKALVAGFNSCAVTKQQYNQAIVRFQALDGIAREIKDLVGKPSLSDSDRTQLKSLVQQYVATARDMSR
jgi:hypothetical protein